MFTFKNQQVAELGSGTSTVKPLIPEREHVIAHVIGAAGGMVTGRCRLQKYVYFLDAAGMNSGFDFDYPGYGPVSNALDRGIYDAITFGLVCERIIHPDHNGHRYGVLTLARDPDELTGPLSSEVVRKILSTLNNEPMLVIGLAATIDWLWRHEGSEDWLNDLRRRQPIRSRGGRVDSALGLLGRIGLLPPDAAKLDRSAPPMSMCASG